MLNPIFNDGRWETCREEQKIEEGQYIIPSLSQHHNFKGGAADAGKIPTMVRH